MNRVESAVIVQRPRAEVFRRLAEDLQQTLPLICSLTLAVELDGNPQLAKGSRGRWTVRTGVFTRATIEFEVTEYETDVRFGIEAWRGRRRVRDEFVFSDREDETEVSVVSTFDLPGPSWLKSWNLRAIGRHNRSDLRRLKALLEGRRPTTLRAARHPWRAMLVYIVVAAVLGAIWATYRSLTS